jgi:hypothetical protein
MNEMEHAQTCNEPRPGCPWEQFPSIAQAIAAHATRHPQSTVRLYKRQTFRHGVWYHNDARTMIRPTFKVNVCEAMRWRCGRRWSPVMKRKNTNGDSGSETLLKIAPYRQQSSTTNGWQHDGRFNVGPVWRAFFLSTMVSYQNPKTKSKK